MKFIHYQPDNKGVRSFSGIKKYLKKTFEQTAEGFYEFYKTPHDFIKFLSDRTDVADIVLVTAHGGKDSYLDIRESYDKPKKIFTTEHASLFSNNFIFAISCYTTQVLGQKVLDENGIVYIGFNDTVESDFVFNNDDQNKSLKYNLEKIFIQVYNKCIGLALYKFVVECRTAISFYKFLDILFRKEVNIVSKMTLDELNKQFSTDLKVETATKLKAILKLEFISKFDMMKSKLVFQGEDYYVPWYFLDKQDENTLEVILQNIQNVNGKYLYYRYFVEHLIYRKLGRPQASEIARRLFEKEVQQLRERVPNVLSEKVIM
ncbi:hypothetical protein AN963_29895 [Brevibacillus choshinensis]|uniref:Peptidase C80 domain-containing protein n=1 Tax=Brevibacillus choshinensis TaxID=54911 RepID=A0ABR5MZU6_BRECH|nr:hypothetical protein [Brevibacillus choshinensis]KQL43626.1 hypothetical protein AN963_29895 [Brevibacillus choshinensis]